MNKFKKRILIDFDRVVHKYRHGWMDGSVYDEPVEGAIDALKRLIEEDYEIVIFTTKSTLGAKRNKEIRDWLKHYGIKGVKITHTKLPAIAIIDDRAVRFTNWQDILHYFV